MIQAPRPLAEAAPPRLLMLRREGTALSGRSPANDPVLPSSPAAVNPGPVGIEAISSDVTATPAFFIVWRILEASGAAVASVVTSLPTLAFNTSRMLESWIELLSRPPSALMASATVGAAASPAAAPPSAAALPASQAVAPASPATTPASPTSGIMARRRGGGGGGGGKGAGQGCMSAMRVARKKMEAAWWCFIVCGVLDRVFGRLL